MDERKRTWFFVGGLLLLGIITHLGLSQPREVVFDEVHFGKFATAYCCTGERFFDIHPPHAKLLTAGTANLLGYTGLRAEGEYFEFEHIGENYGGLSPTQLRFFSALTGILLPVIFFWFLLQLRAPPLVAALGGFALVFDNALIVQTRLIALDGLLLVATFGALAAYLQATPSPNPSLLRRGRVGWLILAGAMAGLAAGTKFTGLSVLAMIGILMTFSLVRLVRTPQRPIVHFLVDAAIVVIAAGVVYVGGWWLHFHYLPNPGPGDAWFELSGNFWSDMVKEHQTMFDANYNLTATHGDASNWWGWPFMHTPVFYWAGAGVIYFIGNPVVWWGAIGLLLLAVLMVFQKKPNWLVLIPFLGLTLSYVPFMRIPRALFLYHYLTPLLFALAVGLLGGTWWIEKRGYELQPWVIGVAIAVFIGFVIMVPLSFGLGGWDDYLSAFFAVFPVWR